MKGSDVQHVKKYCSCSTSAAEPGIIELEQGTRGTAKTDHIGSNCSSFAGEPIIKLEQMINVEQLLGKESIHRSEEPCAGVKE